MGEITHPTIQGMFPFLCYPFHKHNAAETSQEIVSYVDVSSPVSTWLRCGLLATLPTNGFPVSQNGWINTPLHVPLDCNCILLPDEYARCGTSEAVVMITQADVCTWRRRMVSRDL